MANLIKNGAGTTLTDWSAINTTIDNGFKISSGKMLQSFILTDETKSSKYKLSYNCKELKSTNSYFLLTVGLSAGEYNTYFLPIQFSGLVEIVFDMSADTQNIIFELVGNLTVSDIVMDINSELTPQDKLNLLKVSENGAKWDRIIDVTSSTGKLNADMLEGIINTTLNRFANSNGTITQENGEMVFLNGTTVANSTAAMKQGSTGLLIADTKNTDGSWHWDTAVTGAGISASAIVTGVLSAITINGVDITASAFTGGTITSVVMEGNTIYSGDRANGTYMKISNGVIESFQNNIRVFETSLSGAITMYGSDNKRLNIEPTTSYDGKMWAEISASGDAQGLRIRTGNSSINMDYAGHIDLVGTSLTFNGGNI